ncbi:MAG: trigger factor [Phycisphaerae bacterium]
MNQEEQPIESAAEETAEEISEEKAAFEKLKERVQATVEDLGTLRKKVTITIPREAIDERLEKQYSELSREAIVPGFRKGRAPRRLLEKRFGSEVSETITSDLLGSGYVAAIEKVKLKVLGDPLIWCRPKNPPKTEDAETSVSGEQLMTVREAFENIDLPESGSLTFACEVEVQPEFELPELKGIPIQRPKVAITDEDVEKQVDRFRRARAAWQTLADGAVQADDIVVVAMKMSVDGRVVKVQDPATLAARPQAIEGIAFENLGELLNGAKVGDVRRISGTIPDDNESAELRGKTAEFELTIKEIRRLKLPELTTEMLKSVGFDSPEEFRAYIRAELEARLADVIRRGMRSQVYKYLLDHARFDLPERLSQRQANRVVVRRMLELYRQGMPESDVARHVDELQTTARDEAARELKLSLIMEKIAEELKPEVTEDEVNGQIALIARQQNRRFDRVRDELIKNDGIESLFIQLRDEKIVDRLLEQATITEMDPDTDQSSPPTKAATPTGEFKDET